ncbi:MAG TPA: lysophospholipid acyltransferase family protein [Gemmataceae bacterium]|jgi:1-acyl-sn-glycerol-3-phosphate acyltransferase|nr:lysophospholipid acyltransferase family protein [Gemmataceae bacterium]
MSCLFSLLYWVFLATSSVLLFLVALLLRLATAPFDSNRSVLHRFTCRWAQLYVRCLPGCRLRLEGREKIAPHTPYVLVANHQSMIDIMVLSALAVPFKWVSKKEVFRLPFIGWNMALNGYVRVDRGNRRTATASIDACRRWLARGVPVMMFPEGHRSPTGAMLAFHRGAFRLAAEFGCAVVPIVVDGTLPIYRGFRVSAFPGTVRVLVLDPVTLAEAGGSLDRLRDLVHQRMAQALTEIRPARAGAATALREGSSLERT